MINHIPVLRQQILDVFKEIHLSLFIDCTLGAGGHAEALLTAHPEIEQYIGFDQDPVARKLASERLHPWRNKISIYAANFQELASIAEEAKIEQCQGILADLGVSSMQLDTPEKGFSFIKEGPLDM